MKAGLFSLILTAVLQSGVLKADAGNFFENASTTITGQGMANEIKVTSFHPEGFVNIPKYERFEIGVNLPVSYQNNINNFLSSTNGAKLNPYDPDQIRIVGSYTHVTTDSTYNRNGFYYGEFSAKNNLWIAAQTDYPFRVRLAPPLAGKYIAAINFFVWDSLVSTKEFSFTVIESSNPGHVKINAELRRTQFENGEIFFGIGENVPWADWERYNPNFPAGFTNYWEQMSSPNTHQGQRDYIEDVAKNKGNFVRIRLDTWSVPIESFDKTVPVPKVPPQTSHLAKYITNYHHNQQFMWEMDRTLGTCEKNGVYILLTILGDYELCVNDTAYHDEGSLTGWARNPYSGLLNDSSINGVRMFFNSPLVLEAYKKRLYYMEARWGYSTKIAMWQLINETENISGDINNPKKDFKEWDENQSFRNDVVNWLCNIQTILHSYYPPHLVTTATGCHGPDAAPLLSCLDIMSRHDYANNFETESNKYSAREYNRNEHTIKSYKLGQPYIWDEMGLATVPLNQFGDAGFHNSLWGSIFSGAISTCLNFIDWPQINGINHRNNFQAVKAFTDRINFNQKLIPCINNADQKGGYIEYPTSKVLTHYLKREDNLLAYGWTCNNSYNWMSETYPAMSDSLKKFVRKKTGWDGEADFHNFEAKDEMIKVKNLNPHAKYLIEFYDTWEESELLEIQYVRADKKGLLSFGRRMPYQIQSPWHPDYAFILKDVSTARNLSDKKLAERIYPVPASEKIYIDVYFDAEIEKTATVTNELGQSFEKVIGSDNSFNVNDLDAGFYVLKIRDGVLEQSFKFIITRK